MGSPRSVWMPRGKDPCHPSSFMPKRLCTFLNYLGLTGWARVANRATIPSEGRGRRRREGAEYARNPRHQLVQSQTYTAPVW